MAESFRAFNESIARPPNQIILGKDIGSLLPSRDIGHILIEHFFQEINWMVHLVHVPTVRKHLHTFYNDMEDQQSPNFAHLALITTIFTLSAYFCSSASALNTHRKSDIHQWAALARHALSAAECLANPSFETLQSICLILHHIIPNVGSISAVRILTVTVVSLARTLSIDRVDSTSNKKLREGRVINWAEIEVKRRVWWHIVSIDW